MNTAAHISIAAMVAALRQTACQRPLWKLHSVADILDASADEVAARIDDGRLPYAFNIGTGKHKTEPRILALSVLEEKFGPHPIMGKTKNLKLPSVINLILPARDPRSTDLARLLSCDSKHVHQLKTFWRIARPAAAATGPNSFTVFSRASVAAWLTQRRMT